MSLELNDLHKRYGETRAVDGVSLTLQPGETVALLGPSGCGKSTLLRLVAGIEPVDQGRILLEGRDVTRMPPGRRGFGMVFQDYALFPHLSVAGNIGFGLVEQHWPGRARRQRITALLEQVGLAGFEGRRVFELSGGQQQRVALARALAPEPALLLLDEPLSNLDLSLREELKWQLKQLLASLEASAIYVTHDQSEALVLADRVAVMRAGKLVQVASPQELYARPVSAWVARFLGHANLYDARRHPALRRLADADFVLLRSDLIRLSADRRDGAYPARVLTHTTTGSVHTIALEVPDLGVEVVWQGATRELIELQGDVWLAVPERAVVAIEREDA